MLKNDLRNSLLNGKIIVINEVISPNIAPVLDMNDAIVIFPLSTKIKTKSSSKKSRKLIHLPVYLLKFSLSCIF